MKQHDAIPDLSEFISDFDVNAINKLLSDSQDIIEQAEQRARAIPAAEIVLLAPKIIKHVAIAAPKATLAHNVVAGEYDDLIKALNKSDERLIDCLQNDIASALAERLIYEQAQSHCTDAMVANLLKLKNIFNNRNIATVFYLAKADASFINRALRKTSRFNMYAMYKVANIASTIAAGNALAKTEECFIKSMFILRDANIAFNHNAQLAALSKHVRGHKSYESLLVRHNLTRDTAGSQASQCRNALNVLNLISTNNKKGADNIISLHDTPLTRRLRLQCGS